MSKDAYAADVEIQSLLERGMDKTLHWFPSDFNVVRLAIVLVGMANSIGGNVLVGISPAPAIFRELAMPAKRATRYSRLR